MLLSHVIPEENACSLFWRGKGSVLWSLWLSWRPSLLGWTLLGVPGLTTRSKKPLGAPGLTTRSILTTRGMEAMTSLHVGPKSSAQQSSARRITTTAAQVVVVSVSAHAVCRGPHSKKAFMPQLYSQHINQTLVSVHRL